jgi:hypothetical protein
MRRGESEVRCRSHGGIVLDVVAVTETLSIRTTTHTEDKAAAMLAIRTGAACINSYTPEY